MKDRRNEITQYEEYFVNNIDYSLMNKSKNISNAVKVIYKSIYSLEAKKKIKDMILFCKPDIIHLSNIHSHLTPSILSVANKMSIPIIWTLHDYELICPAIHFLSNNIICEKCKINKYYQCTLNKCKKGSYSASFITTIKAYVHKSMNIEHKVNKFIAPSIFLRNKFIEFGWSEDKIVFLRNFLDNPPQISSNVRNVDDYILYLGGLEKWKGLDTLLHVANNNKDIMFNIVGSGSYESKMKKYIHKQRLINVEMVGFLSGDRLRKIMLGALCIVFPSSNYENCPYVIMEAMSLGIPIIGSKIGGIPEMIIDGKTGLLFEPNNSKQLSDKIYLLSNNRSLLKNMGKKSMEYAKDAFDKNKYYNSLIQIYKDTNN